MHQFLLFITSIFFFLNTSTLYAQEKYYSDYNTTFRAINEHYYLTQIDYFKDSTRFHISTAIKNNAIYYAPGSEKSWFIKTEEKTYPLLRIRNIRRDSSLMKGEVEQSNFTATSLNDKAYSVFSCILVFDKLDKTIEQIDLIEGQGKEADTSFFNFFEIKIKSKKDKTLSKNEASTPSNASIIQIYQRRNQKAAEQAGQQAAKVAAEKAAQLAQRKAMIDSYINKVTQLETQKKALSQANYDQKIPADIQQLIKNPDILWLGEVFLDCHFHEDINAKASEASKWNSMGFFGKNYNRVLKHQTSGLDIASIDDRRTEHWLIQKILDNRAQMQLYKDDKLTQQYTNAAADLRGSTIDTIITFNPETFEEEITVVVDYVSAYDLDFFRVKQLVFYNKKDKMFQTKVLALAPMMENPGGYYPLFWIPVGHTSEALSLNNSNIAWSQRLYRSIAFSSVYELKGKGQSAPTVATMLHDIRQQADSVYLGKSGGWDGLQAMDYKAKKDLLIYRDTVSIYDPETFEEVLNVIVYDFADENKSFQEILIMQDWYWDETSKRIQVYCTGFKPYLHRYDDDGNFLNKSNFCVRRTGWDMRIKKQ